MNPLFPAKQLNNDLVPRLAMPDRRRGLPIYLRLLAFALVFYAAVTGVSAQQPESSRTASNWVIKIDERGDAMVDFKLYYSASEWTASKESLSERPDMVLRDLRYLLASSVLEDFSMEKDDVQRSALVRFKARAYASYRSAGDFVIPISKDKKLATGANSDWFFTTATSQAGDTDIQSFQIKLPVAAENVKFAPGADFNYLSYTHNASAERPKGWVTAGVAILATGLSLFVISLFTNRTETVVRRTT